MTARLSWLAVTPICITLGFGQAIAAESTESSPAAAKNTVAGMASADSKSWRFSLETGPVWQQRNDVQIPGDTGTRFSLVNLVGDGPFPFYRIEMDYTVAPRQQWRFVVAPFRYEEDGVLGKDVFFVDETFAAGEKTRATYQFNSYRVTYRYRFSDGPWWRWWIGGTAKVRDAEIALRQNGRSASKTDLGLVPLLNLYGDLKLAERWHFSVDFDGLVAPQGRALDLGLIASRDLTNRWSIGGGYRTLEGGVDNNTVYNFTRLNYAVLSVDYRF